MNPSTADRNETTKSAQWAETLKRAVHEPGTIGTAYKRFHRFSTGNQLLALFQCLTRGINPGPIHTFKGWIDLGRHVKKGEKAIALVMPVTCKAKSKTSTAPASSIEGACADTGGVFTRFIERRNWFVMAQTDGAEYQEVDAPEWNEARALATLDVTREDFTSTEGNAHGYAYNRTVSVSPLADYPARTLFHELAHVLLGHTTEAAQMDNQRTPKTLQEAEAEAVALLVCESLGMPGADHSRGYIQGWYGAGNELPERSAQRVMKAADQILKAGQPKREQHDDE